MKSAFIVSLFSGLFFLGCSLPQVQSLKDPTLLDMALCKEPKTGINRLLMQLDQMFAKKGLFYNSKQPIRYKGLPLAAISPSGVGYLPGFALLFSAPFAETRKVVGDYRKKDFSACTRVACEELLDDKRLIVLKRYKNDLTVLMCADFKSGEEQ